MALRSELSVAQLRAEFERGQGLVLTDKGWLPPRSVLAGPPIFGSLAAFAPAVAGTDRLWQVLNLREPTPEDCVKVRPKHRLANVNILVARMRPSYWKPMRALAAHYSNENTLKPDKRRLARLPLWTSKGWMRERPVFAMGDSVLAKGLRDQIPLWEPGGDLEQFRSLIDPLRIKEIQAGDAEVIKPAQADEDADTTDLFRSALGLLREDLARNEPQLAASVKIPWETLETFGVSVHPSLSLRVCVRYKGKDEEYISDVDAKVDITQGEVFVKDPLTLPRVDIGGSALAEVFDGNPRRLAQAWRAACDKAEDGLKAQRVVLAQQRAEQIKAQNEKDLERRTTEFREWTSGKQRSSGGPASTASTLGVNGQVGKSGPKATELGAPRTLVDPNSLKIADRLGRIAEETNTAHFKKSRGAELQEPKRASTTPRNRKPIPGYSSLDRENVGMELVRRVLSSDEKEDP